jgi:hypothetical protein
MSKKKLPTKKTVAAETPQLPTNPFAFPVSSRGSDFFMHHGMTLRDYFAAAIVNGALAGETGGNGGTVASESAQALARNVYALADAMLAARDHKRTA